jgi:hypothetical protein
MKTKKRPIVKITQEIWCFADEVDMVKESLGDWFGACEAALYGGAPEITKATAVEDEEARPELEEG